MTQKYLRLLREAEELTQLELGFKAGGTHPSRISALECGKAVGFPGELSRLAAALGYTGDPADLMLEADDAQLD
jgi:transcriptional regulator with XRE-family HTH domain